MIDLTKFNIIETEDTFDLIPDGNYTAIITDSEECTTKKGDGAYIKLTFQIAEGNQEGRLIWVNLNLENPNPKAVEIAHKELSNICKAVGVNDIKDKSDLHDKPMLIKVGVKKGNNGYDDQNRIKNYKRIDNGQPWKR